MPRRLFIGIEQWEDEAYRSRVRAVLDRELRRARAIDARTAAELAAAAAVATVARVSVRAVPFDLNADAKGKAQRAARLAGEIGRPRLRGWWGRLWIAVAQRIAPDELLAGVLADVDGAASLDVEHATDAVRKRRTESRAPMVRRLSSEFEAQTGQTLGQQVGGPDRDQFIAGVTDALDAEIEELATAWAEVLLLEVNRAAR